MENISKALIIVGGILLTILILTLLVFIFNKISVIPQEQQIQSGEMGIVEYNRSFEVYQKPLMYGTDIISVINKAVDHNLRNGLLSNGSNFFSKAFTNPTYGQLMSIYVKLNSTEDKLDFNTRVRIYYVIKESDGIREKEYVRGVAIPGHESDAFNDVLGDSQYKELLKRSGIDLNDKPFKSDEYPYNFSYGKDFLKNEGGNITLFAGDSNQDVKANKSLIKFLEVEPITILNPDPKDMSWSKVVITSPSSKLKKMIFTSLKDKTEYYEYGRIKAMHFEEK